jgi:hypothetical protein
MGKDKSLKEVRELFQDTVEPEFIKFSPNDCWIVSQRKYDVNSEEYFTESFLKMNLYSMLRPILEQGSPASYITRLYELCVTAGQGSHSALNSCYLNTENASDSCWIQYEGPFVLGNDKNKIANSTPTVQSLALESISIITELARKNDLDKLLEVKNYLIYFQE